MDSYRNPTIRKQISVFLPAGEWRTLRDEAARRRVSMAELCRVWLRPELDRAGLDGAGLDRTGRAGPDCNARPGADSDRLDPGRRGPHRPPNRGRPD